MYEPLCTWSNGIRSFDSVGDDTSYHESSAAKEQTVQVFRRPQCSYMTPRSPTLLCHTTRPCHDVANRVSSWFLVSSVDDVENNLLRADIPQHLLAGSM